MILVLGGTRDGRELAAELREAGYSVMVSVTSHYGMELARRSVERVQAEAMTQAELERFIQENSVDLLVDATHPYAVNISRNAVSAAQKTGVSYLRYERPSSELPVYERLIMVPDMNSAAEVAVLSGKTVFLTVGSHTLPIFRNAAKEKSCRLIARVLPQPDVITDCLAAGFSPADIVAMQGPFSKDFNKAMFREYEADVVVTKNSGTAGGTDEKLKAAMELGLKLVVVGRPKLVQEEVFTSISALAEHVKRSY